MAISACLVATAPAGAGGGEQGDIELGIYGGYGWPDDYSSTAGARNPEDDVLFGARIGGFFNPRWSLEF